MQKKIIPFATADSNPDIPHVNDVRAEEVHEKKDFVNVIDVREVDEFTGELGHIPGAKLVVLNTLPQHLEEIPRDATVVFVCRSGGRSARATAFVLDQGFEHVYNMKGGMLRWNSLKFETEGKG